MTGTKQKINPVSGESVGISGVITDPSDQQINWTLTIAGTGRTFSGTGKSPSVTWDGKDSSGRIVTDGIYTATLTAKTADGKCSDSANTAIEVKNNPDCKLNKPIGSTVNVATGGLSHDQKLFSLTGGALPANISLYYDSLAPRTVPLDTDLIEHFQKVLEPQVDGSLLYRTWAGTTLFTLSETVFVPPAGSSATLVLNPDGTYTLTGEDGSVNLFQQDGKILSTVESSGKHYTFAYSVDSVSVTDPQNKTTSFSTLYYNSIYPFTGALGEGWSHSYDIVLQDQGNGAILFRNGPSPRLYVRSGTGYVSPPGDFSAFVKNSDGTYVITEKEGLKHTFDQWGRIISRTDANGSSLTFDYSGGNLATVTDSAGRAINFSYDTADKVISIADPKGNAYAFSYLDGNLVSVTHPDGGQWSYTYDADDFLLTKSDPGGNTTTYAYDANYRVLASTDPEGKTRNLTYPQESVESVKNTAFTEKDGGVWTTTYDTSRGTVTSKTDPLGNTISYTYDANKNMLSKTEPIAGTTSYTYDANDNMLTTTDPLGNVTSYTYNATGQVLYTTGPQGTVFNTYDTKGNILTTTDLVGATTTYEYDTHGNLTKSTNAKGQVSTFAYDGAGLLTSSTDPTGAVVSFTYDANGNMATQTDAAGKAANFSYDGMNRLVSTTDPLGHVTTYGYDKLGRRISQADANGNTTTFKFNYLGQMIESKDALGKTTTFAYGATGCPSCGGGVDKLTRLTDAKGQATTWQYDVLGRLTQEADPMQQSMQIATFFGYDAAGNMTSKTTADGTANGISIAYSYDPLRRLTAKTYPDGSNESYAYNAAGRLTTATNSNVSYSYAYDATGRVTSVTDSRGYAIAYEYDLVGNRTKMTFQPGTPDERVITYSFDNGNRPTGITSPAGTFTYGYDTRGRRTNLGYPNQVTANYSYDDAGRMTALTHAVGGSTIASFSYILDNVGNRASKITAEAEQYLYDLVYRLLAVSSGKPETFTYDVVGNRQTGPGAKDTGYLYNTGNQMTRGRKLQYGYDNNGNQITRTIPAVPEQKWNQKWDFENRLIKVEKSSGSDGRTVSFKYDPYGRRIEKNVDITFNGTTETSIYRYVYDNDNIILELLTDGNGTSKTFYTQGLNTDEHLALERNGQNYYYHADGLGSITAITDQNNAVVQTYEYDSFGMVKPSTSFRNRYTFTGREWDREAGLYYYRARYYDPMEGRFIQKDPIGFDGGDVVLYGYVQNNPVNWTDPYGLHGPSVPIPSGATPAIPTNTCHNPANHNTTNLRDSYCQSGARAIACAADVTLVIATIQGAVPLGYVATGISVFNGVVSFTVCGFSPSTVTTAAGARQWLPGNNGRTLSVIIATIDAALTAAGL